MVPAVDALPIPFRSIEVGMPGQMMEGKTDAIAVGSAREGAINVLSFRQLFTGLVTRTVKLSFGQA